MAKVSLADSLAGRLAEPPAAEPEPAVAVTAAPPEPPKARKRTRAPVAAPEPPPEPGLPRYLTLERVEGRLRLDQLDDLSALTRRLNRARGRGVGERITNNSLLRVAADLLLANSARLSGTTEAELRRSLGLPELRSPEPLDP